MKRALGIAVGGFLAASGCQSYDAQPVSPNAIEVQDNTQTIVGHPLAPNIMLVVDRSGSMTDGADGNHPSICDPNSTYLGRGPDCKWNNLLDVLIGPAGTTGQGFLADLDQAFMTNANAGDPIPLGLTEFAGSTDASTTADACAPGKVLNTIAPMNESAITQTLLGIVPLGGTPTAATLALVQNSFPQSDPNVKAQRANYVILLTDGAPNCDSNFSPSANTCSGDRCTLGACAATDYGNPNCNCTPNGTAIPEGCLDESAAVTAVANLAAANIKTFVIGFGAVTTAPSAAETLNKMGAAGGGGMTSGGQSYYQAASSSDLQAALQAILGIIGNQKCTYSLEQSPPSQQLIEVLITPSGGTTSTLAQSQFSYDMNAKQITITDMTVCNAILSSTPNNPYGLEIKYLTTE